MKKAVLLTLWLLLPMLVVGGLMAWVFISMDKDKPMMDLPALGAGGGDTGGVNAIGEMLYGNDPDAIQHAKRAQQEQTAMDPRDWPGGVEIQVPLRAIGERVDSLVLTLFHDERGERSTINQFERTDDAFVFRIEQDALEGSRFVIWTAQPMVVSDAGYHTDSPEHHLLRMFELVEQVPPRALEVSDPWLLDFRIDSLFEESP